MKKFLEIGILGADGRMGQAIIHALSKRSGVKLSAAVTFSGSPNLGQDAGDVAGLKPCGVILTSDIRAAADMCDVLIDFSAPQAAIDAVRAMTDTRCQTLVTGTTGYTDAESEALLKSSKNITLLKSGNFSMGVNMLEALVEIATRSLKTGWDVEVLEMHHKHKVDAPSGTALMLGEAAAKGRGVTLSEKQKLSREGREEPRPEGQIGFAALRGGGVVGQHEVRIANELEMITLGHDAFDRSVFAQGAVESALWAAGQPAGFYDMKDVLGLSD